MQSNMQRAFWDRAVLNVEKNWVKTEMTLFQRRLFCAVSLLLLFLTSKNDRAQAQTAAQARVVESVRNDQLVALGGNIHPRARAANDRGILPDTQPVTRMELLLLRSAAQEAALEQLMAEQLDRKSPRYHAWLAPQEFGERFGPADSDIQAVKDWLASEGFADLKVNNGKTLIEFRGTAGQVRNAFHTEIHRLSVNGEEHFANMQEPRIPAALAPVISGVVGLHNFHPKPQLRRVGKFRRNIYTGEITPLFTFTDVNGTFYGVGPADFATIYNVPSSLNGSGVSIAIVGQSNVNPQDIADFRSIFGLPVNPPKVILNGPDPGLAPGDEEESDVDLEWSGAVAQQASIILVTTQMTDTDGVSGVDASAEYIVDNNIAPILSESYGVCELGLGNAFNQFYASLWQQAAAEGISAIVSTGDSGSASCDDPSSETSAISGVAVSGIASTPYNVAMGGTDFDQAGNQSKYWMTANTSTNPPVPASALGYIPETTWNDSCGNAGLTGCNSVTGGSSSLNLAAGGGGASNCATQSSSNACTAGRPKPSWQQGVTPNDGVRDLPDLSLFASDGQNKSFYIVCQSDMDITGDTGCNLTTFSPSTPFHDFQAVGGTSVAAPTFAGIMALINQKTGQRQGNPNVPLYALATTENFSNCNSSGGTSGGPGSACVFNDVTKGTNAVPCTAGKPNCSNSGNNGFGVLELKGAVAYAAGAGYDLATGLGSPNVTNLVNRWSAAGLIGTSITLAPSSVTGTAGTNVSLSGTVSKSSGSASPTGVVVLENAGNMPAGNLPALNIQVGGSGGGAALNGSAAYSVSTSFLPAGNYMLKAHYGGDTTYGPSDSAPISVNLSTMSSQVVVSFVNASGNLVTGSQNVAYGSSYILRVDVTKSGGTPCQSLSSSGVGTSNFICPTGQVALFDGGNPLNDFPNAQNPNATNIANLNDRGFVEDQPIQLSVGTHPITATYTAAAGSSYTSQSSSNTVTVTITQATTSTSVNSNTFSVVSGGSVTLTASVSSQSDSQQGPTGTVQFLNGGSNLGTAAACTPQAANNNATPPVGASCTAQLTTTLSALPPGFLVDSRPRNAPLAIVTCLATALALATFLLAARMPARRRLYAYAGVAFFVLLAVALAGCSGGSSSGGGSGRKITASYSGDKNYSGSTSSSITITVQ
jgi:hypothetical protein